MYEEFGRLSFDQLNEMAEKLANQGDEDALRRLAAENRIDNLNVKLYLEGDTDALCEDILDAALSRLDVETDDLGAEEIMGDWADYIRSLVMDEEGMAEKVMDSGKTFKGCVGTLAAWSICHAEPLDKEIIKAMEHAVSDAQLKKLGMQRNHLQYTKLGIPGMGTAKRLIREYYGGH